MIGVYKIENKINGKIYIGMSGIDCKKRFWDHKSLLSLDKHFNQHLQASFNKYGEDVFSFEVLEECSSVDEALDREVFWINEFGTTDSSKGYNKSFGGDRPVLTKETREKISKSLMGHPVSEEAIKKMVANRRSFAGENNPMYGVPCSEEHKEKLRKLHTGRKFSLEHKQKMSASWRADIHEKPVLQYTKEGVFVKRWKSCAAAGRGVGLINGGGISSVCLGVKKQGFVVKAAGDFMWRHCNGGLISLVIEGYEKSEYTPRPPYKGKTVLQYTINGEFVREHKSARAADAFLEIAEGCVANACRGVSKTSHGCVWKYKEDVI